MRKTIKQILAFGLLAVMLLTMLPFAAFAEGETADSKIVFDFTGLVTEGSLEHANYEATEIGRNWINAMTSYGPVVSYPEYTQYGPEIKDTYYLWEYRYWFAITLKEIPAAAYNLTLELAENTGKTCPVEMYIVPRSALAKINTSGPMAQMNKNTPVTTFDGNKTEVTVSSLQLADDPNGEYLLMFNFLPAETGKELESLTDTTIKLKTLTLEKKTAVKPTTAPTIPDFNTPEEPADDAGSFPVVPVVIAAVAVVAVAVVVVIVLKKKKNG